MFWKSQSFFPNRQRTWWELQMPCSPERMGGGTGPAGTDWRWQKPPASFLFHQLLSKGRLIFLFTHSGLQGGHLLLSSDRCNPGRARIGPSWVRAIQNKLLLTAGDPTVSRTSAGKTTIFGSHLPGVKWCPVLWGNGTSSPFTSTQQRSEGPYEIRH